MKHANDRKEDDGNERSEKRRRLLTTVLPVIVLILGIGLAAYVIVSEPAAKRTEQAATGTLVETSTVERAEHQLSVRTQGSVRSLNEVAVIPQVSGKVVNLNPDLIAGGFLREGELLYQIDPEDYRVELQRQEAALAEAKAALALEEGQREVAQREWELLGESLSENQKAPALALREPQLQQAEAAVSSAEAALAGAKLQLERTRVTAPFNAVVASETVTIGQSVGPQSETARLVSVDQLHVHAAVPAQDLAVIDVGEQGSPAEVEFDLGETSVVYRGRTVQLLPQLVESSRMAQLLIQIDSPFQRFLADDSAASQDNSLPSANQAVPLLIDSFVNVRIRIPRTIEAVELDREYLHGDEVWVMRGGKLEIRSVQIAWERPETVLISAGLDDGDRVVTTSIASPVDGLPLRNANRTGSVSASGENSRND